MLLVKLFIQQNVFSTGKHMLDAANTAESRNTSPNV